METPVQWEQDQGHQFISCWPPAVSFVKHMSLVETKSLAELKENIASFSWICLIVYYNLKNRVKNMNISGIAQFSVKLSSGKTH